MNRREFGRLAGVAALFAASGRRALAGDWTAVLDEAKGQTVYFHAWGGDPKINDFIAWVGGLAQERHGVGLSHVKLAATSDALARVLAEQTAGQTEGGAVDLIWINGENFAAMKAKGLLFGPFAPDLPNFVHVDVTGQPATVTDFTLPTDGFESPWAMARLVFEHDSARVATPPATVAALADWARVNPGRVTYPQTPDKGGITLRNQVLYGRIADPAVPQRPGGDRYDSQTKPLWDYLDALHPALWRGAAAFPANEPAMGQLLADGEVDIAFAFNPGRASAEILAGNLTPTVRTFVLQGGTIGNASFVAIPFNAAHRAGAQVLANLLLDPQVQARAQDPAILGFQTVLDVGHLPTPDADRFAALDLGPATLAPADLGPALLEPHGSWVTRLSDDWVKRYGVAP